MMPARPYPEEIRQHERVDLGDFHNMLAGRLPAPFTPSVLCQ